MLGRDHERRYHVSNTNASTKLCGIGGFKHGRVEKERTSVLSDAKETKATAQERFVGESFQNIMSEYVFNIGVCAGRCEKEETKAVLIMHGQYNVDVVIRV